MQFQRKPRAAVFIEPFILQTEVVPHAKRFRYDTFLSALRDSFDVVIADIYGQWTPSRDSFFAALRHVGYHTYYDPYIVSLMTMRMLNASKTAESVYIATINIAMLPILEEVARAGVQIVSMIPELPQPFYNIPGFDTFGANDEFLRNVTDPTDFQASFETANESE